MKNGNPHQYTERTLLSYSIKMRGGTWKRYRYSCTVGSTTRVLFPLSVQPVSVRGSVGSDLIDWESIVSGNSLLTTDNNIRKPHQTMYRSNFTINWLIINFFKTSIIRLRVMWRDRGTVPFEYGSCSWNRVCVSGEGYCFNLSCTRSQQKHFLHTGTLYLIVTVVLDFTKVVED